MRFLAIASLVLVTLAGCTTPAEPAQLSASAPERVDPLSGITELHWASVENLGDTVLEFSFDVGDDNECDFTVAVSAQKDAPGPTALSILESQNHRGWGMGGSGSLASAHAGPVDSDTILGGGGRSGGLYGTRGTFAGLVNITLVAPGVHYWDDNPFLRNASVALDVECDGSFSVAAANIGHTILLENAASLRGGAGAAASFQGTVNAEDRATLEVAAGRARAGMGSFGTQAGQVTLDHPGGSEEWTLDPASGVPTVMLDGSAGAYAFTVTRAAALFDAFWVTAYGIDGPLDLTPGLRSEDGTDSPF